MDKTRTASQIEKRVHFDRAWSNEIRHGNNESTNRSSCVERVTVLEINPKSASHKVARAADQTAASRTTCASRAIRSRRPTSISRRSRNPCHTISRSRCAGRLQCRAGFRDTSFARTPCAELFVHAGSAREVSAYFTHAIKLVHGQIMTSQQRPHVHGDVPNRKIEEIRKTVIPSSNRHQTNHLTLCYKKLSTPLRRLTDGSDVR